MLRHVGEDGRCQDDLLICTCTRMRSVYCCHHLKPKKNVCFVVTENDWFLLVYSPCAAIVNKVMTDGVWE